MKFWVELPPRVARFRDRLSEIVVDCRRKTATALNKKYETHSNEA